METHSLNHLSCDTHTEVDTDLSSLNVCIFKQWKVKNKMLESELVIKVQNQQLSTLFEDLET